MPLTCCARLVDFVDVFSHKMNVVTKAKFRLDPLSPHKRIPSPPNLQRTTDQTGRDATWFCPHCVCRHCAIGSGFLLANRAT